MCSLQLVLLQVFFLTLPENAQPQPSSSASGAVPTSPDLGPGTLGGTVQSSSEGTATPPDVLGISTVGPTLVTSSAPRNRTVELFPVLPICVCDLTPGTCDINCCCDRDCYLLHPRTVFSFCLPGSVRSSSWVCVDNSLIFRSNSPFPSRVFMDSNGIRQFCVHVNNCFLESKHTTCTRFFKNLASSCTLDSALNAASYCDFTVLKVPRGMTDLQNMEAFQQSTAASLTGPRSGNPGYIVGKPLLALTGDISYSMTLLQSQGNGTCSVKRHEVQFGMNAMSGCKLRVKTANCSHLQQEIYQTLHGRLRPEHIAIFGNAYPAQKGGWTKILHRSCSVSAKNCTSCCFIPVSLEIQVLWAFIGLQSNPQAHVSAARFLYQCQSVEDSQEVPLTTLVNFVDITRKPEPPRGQPRMDWKLPFDFFFPFKVAFSRGIDSQKGSVPPILILCLLLLGVLSLETK
ncbi:PREDICTED: tectonic-3 isoform X2 [Propithecus coquereli]|uniref:Tectonic family member 3 n=1 Tax=Propithecus coquereli TaxID=379532 RepID=A0A2K6F7L8_PROCO|nr:PREDICTED: tectonic-3 isoform X2 [Propithecus coquereli]